MTYIADRRNSEWNPTDHNLLAWTFDPGLPNSGAGVTSGTLQIVRLHLRTAASVTNILMHVQTAGITLTAGQSFAALYTAAGVKVAVTADQAAAWVSTGVKTMALAGGPYALAAGDYYVAVWSVGATPPQFMRMAGTSSGLTNVGLSAPNFRAATADAGLTTTAPDPIGAQTANSANFWAALS